MKPGPVNVENQENHRISTNSGEMSSKRKREEDDETFSGSYAKQIKKEDDLDTSCGCLKTRNSKLIDGDDKGVDGVSQTHSSLHVPLPVVHISLREEPAKKENIAPVQRENSLSADEEMGKLGDGQSRKISNQHFEVITEPESLDNRHLTSFKNEKANIKERDLSEITAEFEIIADLCVELSNTEDNSKEKVAQILKEAIPMDGKTKQAFLIDNQPFTIKTVPETIDSGNDVSENRIVKSNKIGVENRPADSYNLLDSISSDNRNTESEEETVQESMITRPVDDYTQSKQVIVIGNESFTITINPEYEDDIHCASSANEKARSEENVSQKFTVPSSMDGYSRQGQCVQPIIFKTEPEAPVDVSVSSATKQANIMEESAQVMTETGLEDSDTHLKQYLHTHSQPFTVKTKADSWEEVSESSADRKDNNKVQTAQILTDTRPRDSYTQLEHCFQTHHQPFIIKTEPETWDHIPVCSIKKKETNKEKYAQEITIANPVDSNTKIQQIHQIQNQSFIIKSEPVTGDDFLESCVNMEAKSMDKTEQELTTTGLVDGYFQSDKEFGKSRGGRSGRARKKSAKVLEMEEFEEVKRKRLKKEVRRKSITSIQNQDKYAIHSRPTFPDLAITSPQSMTKLNVSNLLMPANPLQTLIRPAKKNTGQKSPNALPIHAVQGGSKFSGATLLLRFPTQASSSFIPSTPITQVSSPTSHKPTTSSKRKAKSKEIDSKETIPKVEKVKTKKPKVKMEKKSPEDFSVGTKPTIPSPNVIHIDSKSLADIETKPELEIFSDWKRKPVKAKLEQEEEAKISDENELDVLEMPSSEMFDLMLTQSSEKKKVQQSKDIGNHKKKGQPRQPKQRELRYKNYEEESLKAAFQQVKEEGVSIKEAAELFGVPHSTLRDRVVGEADPEDYGTETVFTTDEERKLVEHIQWRTKLGYELPNVSIQRLAGEVAYEMKRKKTIAPMGNNWLYAFLNRWKSSIKSVKLRHLDNVRAKCSTGEQFDNYFMQLKTVLKENNLLDKPHRIFNIAETDLQRKQKPSNLIVNHYTKVRATLPRNTTTTFIACVNALGQSLPPVFIFKGKESNPELMKGACFGAKGIMSETGWSNGEIFRKFLKEDLLPFVGSAAIDDPILLICDGHASYKTHKTIHWAREKGIILSMVPAHISHLIQPLHVGVYGPFKRHYYSECAKYLASHRGMNITRYDICSLASSAYLKSFTAINIQAGFKRTGMFPFDMNIGATETP